MFFSAADGTQGVVEVSDRVEPNVKGTARDDVDVDSVFRLDGGMSLDAAGSLVRSDILRKNLCGKL